jgi:glyoxylase-like metal-dependent hydrolase (beta-lactamase superfamily II)
MKIKILLLPIILLIFSCGESSKAIEIIQNENWTVVNDRIHIYSTSSVNSTIITSSDKTVLINPGSGKEAFSEIESYCNSEDLVITDVLITNSHRKYSGNIHLYRDLGIPYHSMRNLEGSDQLILGKLTLDIVHLNDYEFGSSVGYMIDGAIFISGGIIEEEKPFRRSMDDQELKSLRLMEELELQLIIPGSGHLLAGEQIMDYMVARRDSVKYSIQRNSADFTQVNDNIFIFTGSDMVAQQFNCTVLVSDSDAAIFDTGTGLPIVMQIEKFLKARDLTVRHIFITHDHFDHADNLDFFAGEGIKVHRWDNSSEGDEIFINDNVVRIIETSGHYGKDKHISFEIDDDVLVSGDILVANVRDVSILISDQEDMINTLERFLRTPYSLIIPGHAALQQDKGLIELYLSQLN